MRLPPLLRRRCCQRLITHEMMMEFMNGRAAMDTDVLRATGVPGGGFRGQRGDMLLEGSGGDAHGVPPACRGGDVV